MNCCMCNKKTIGEKEAIRLRPYIFCSYVCMYSLLSFEEIDYLLNELY